MIEKNNIVKIDSKIEKSVIIAIDYQSFEPNQCQSNIAELSFLAQTAGAEVVKVFKQKLDKAHTKFYVGTGKLNEVKAYITEEKIELVIFDDELTPSQIKHIEAVLDCKIIDRSSLILDIFAKHAQTSQAKTQVDLAQCEYLLPRLTKLWTHLSRQKGGIGMKGPGEKEIETDRRVIRNKISLLKEKLKEIDKQSNTRRKARTGKIKVVLVGYTNVGKSTIMNMISDAEVLAENKLFATLDTTIRKVFFHGQSFLLADSVGFINKLPHHLVESFKSTLDEVREADIIVHVIDISHPNHDSQMLTVSKTLGELGASDTTTLYVFNKIDLFEHPDLHENASLSDKAAFVLNMYEAKNVGDVVAISAQKRFNLQIFTMMLSGLVETATNKLYKSNAVV